VADERTEFEVALVTPEGTVYEGPVDMVIVPGAAGEIGVLARHAPLVAMLKAGSTRIHAGGGPVLEYATGPGFFRVERNRALALVDDAVDTRAIDVERAEQQLAEAQEDLERVDAGELDADRWQIEQRLRHAKNQLAVIGRVPS
jgi:F-type H+-transporting ATPase subunit epsilon